MTEKPGKLRCTVEVMGGERYVPLLTFFPLYRKEGGKFGFAESLPDKKITALKREKMPVDTKDIEEKAEEIIAKSEPPSDMYPLQQICPHRRLRSSK